MQRIIIIFVVCVFVSTVSAEPTWHTAKVKQLYPLSDGAIVVIFDKDNTACPNTNSPQYYYLRTGTNGVTADGLKNMYSALLAAAASGKDVVINFESSNSDCAINRLTVLF